MSKFLRLLVILVIIIPCLVKAQTQPSHEYFQNLFKQNAAIIGIAQKDLSNWRISDAHYDKLSNSMFIYLQQTYLGIDIDKAVNSLSFKDEKFVTGNLEELKNLKSLNKTTAPLIDAKTALLNAAGNLNTTIKSIIIPLQTIAESHTYIFDKLGISYNQIPVKLLWLRNDENNLQLAWQVTISAVEKNALWQINIDAATGKIISKDNLTVYEQTPHDIKKPHEIFVFDEADQPAVNSVQDLKSINSAKYNVIAYPNESPLYALPSLQTNPWTINGNQNANTLKWNSDGSNDYSTLRGNNVLVQQDLDSNNNTPGFSASSTTSLPDLTFNFNFDETADPTIAPTASFNETNFFYWDNLMHDMSYQYGFDEASGNFQTNNLSRGGSENDFVYADAQDGNGKGPRIDNANMSTPTDGFNPRQQMFLWYPDAFKNLYINSPAGFKGDKPSLEGAVSTKNALSKKQPVTADIIIYKDAAHPDSSTGCGVAANANEISGKIVYVDRGSCAYVQKYKNAQTAGAKAIIVGNVAPNDKRYIPPVGTTDTRGNYLLAMGGTDNTITIPGIFIRYDSAQKIKALGSGNVNATLYSPDLDGGLDNTVSTHEYTHGISNRLIGGPQNVTCLRNVEQMGEGWSDWYALIMTENWSTASVVGAHNRTIGSYAVGFDVNYGLDANTVSILRAYPTSNSFTYDPWTYDSLKALKGTILKPADEHTVGEIWCTMLWDMTWDLAKDYGISQNIFNAAGTGGNIIALKLITEGLKLTNCSPGFVDARDGILKADTLLYSGKYSKEIWTAFAKRGLGYSAGEGSSGNTNDGTAAYDLPSGILPVEFGDFTAQKQGNTSLLKWTTVQESNTDKFIAERSADGKNYSSIGTVTAAGNSAVKTSYQLIDQQPFNGNNIYRIKEFDKDGKFNLSDLRALNFADLKPYIQISPNPAKNIVTINIPGNNQNLTVKLLSSNGQLLINKKLDGETLKLDVSTLAAGVYNITIDGKGYSAKYKIVIQ